MPGMEATISNTEHLEGNCMAELSLNTFNNRVMNGLVFCKKVYDLYEQIRKSPNGLEKLRLRRNKSEKKLIVELVPLAKYVQARYSCGRHIRIKWIDGSQEYDAIVWHSGHAAEKAESRSASSSK